MDNDEIARDILARNSYVVLATADAHGVPWASPVWFAQEDYHELFWVSAPDARHSRNVAVRPEIAMVVFDSTVTPGDGQAVYISAFASPAGSGLDVYSRAAVRSGLEPWGQERVSGDARLRLYRAEITEYSILDPAVDIDVRIRVSP